jgi:plasmid maintenance system antidote protein VapI
MPIYYTESELVEQLRERVKEAGSQEKFAQTHGLMQVQVSQVLLGKRSITQDFARKVFGLEKIVVFQEKTA